MVEMYTVQRFLDPEGLEERGLAHFDAWAATFGEVVDAMELAPDGASLRPRSRFARFTNLPELQQMFRSYADVQTAAMLHLPRPRLAGGKAMVIACPMSAEQCALQETLVARYEAVRSGQVKPWEETPWPSPRTAASWRSMRGCSPPLHRTFLRPKSTPWSR